MAKNKVSSKLMLDSHHEIERFGVLFITLAFIFTSLTIAAGYSAHERGQADLSTTAIYTASFESSRTNTSGDVVGVYRDKDKTKALVLMHFDNMLEMSTDANTYQAFVTGATDNLSFTRLKTAFNGQILVFGNTGYIGLLLEQQDGKPITPQILTLTMRANDELVYHEGGPDISADLEGQESFKKHDQWRMYINPTANEAKHVEALDSSKIDITKLYYQTVGKVEEEEVRSEMTESLAKMRVHLAKIAQLENELSNVTTVDGLFLMPARVEGGDEQLQSIVGDRIINVDTEDEADATTPKDKLWLDSPYTSSAGYDFDWRSGNIYDGYLADLVEKGQNYGAYLSDKAAKKDSSGSSSVINWKLNDDSYLNDSALPRSVLAPLFEIKTNLESVYGDYMAEKQLYQEDMYNDLLELELDLQNVKLSSTVNATKDALVMY